MKNDFFRKQNIASVIANAFVVAIVVCAFVLEAYSPDLYYLYSQEDEYVEWATFWSFLLAAFLFLMLALSDLKSKRRGAWFSFCVSLFCVFVAMEEISWGQRILGYKPPEYFLQNNFQQEFNIHNIAQKSLRKILFVSIVFGYGVLLPVVGRVQGAKRMLDRLGVTAPPPVVLPVFLISLGLYYWNPWRFAAEWVELTFGLGLLFSAYFIDYNGKYCIQKNADAEKNCAGQLKGIITLLVVILFVIAGGGLSAKFSRAQRTLHPGNLAAARVELNALKKDLYNWPPRLGCIVHTRFYTHVEESKNFNLRLGEYASLGFQGMPVDRSNYFIDPWNMSYWLFRNCKEGFFYIYSFGPNRKRDSFGEKIGGDDIGVYLIEQ